MHGLDKPGVFTTVSQFVVEKRQGFLQRGGKALLERLTQLGEALEATPQFGQCVQGRLGPTAPIKQGVDLDHDLAECPQLRYPRVSRHHCWRSLWLR